VEDLLQKYSQNIEAKNDSVRNNKGGKLTFKTLYSGSISVVLSSCWMEKELRLNDKGFTNLESRFLMR